MLKAIWSSTLALIVLLAHTTNAEEENKMIKRMIVPSYGGSAMDPPFDRLPPDTYSTHPPAGVSVATSYTKLNGDGATYSYIQQHDAAGQDGSVSQYSQDGGISQYSQDGVPEEQTYDAHSGILNQNYDVNPEQHGHDFDSLEYDGGHGSGGGGHGGGGGGHGGGGGGHGGGGGGHGGGGGGHGGGGDGEGHTSFQIVKVPQVFKYTVIKKVPYKVVIEVPKPYTVPYHIPKEVLVPRPVQVQVYKPTIVHVPKPFHVTKHVVTTTKVEKRVPIEIHKAVKHEYEHKIVVKKPVYISTNYGGGGGGGGHGGGGGGGGHGGGGGGGKGGHHG